MSAVSSPAGSFAGSSAELSAGSSAEVANNPLLIGKGLPPFGAIKAEHVVPGITRLLAELSQDLKALEAQLAAKLQSSSPILWADLIDPLTDLTERFGWSWGIVGHLMGVKNSPELRTAYEQVQPALVQFANEISQSQVLYDALKHLQDSEVWETLESAQQRIVAAALRDAELSGVGLAGAVKVKFNEIQQALAELSTQFSNHVLDATKAFSLTLTEKDEVAGLPLSLLSLTAQAAREAGDAAATPEAGPWRITLDMPCYIPFLQHARRRDLREKLYRAFITRASAGEWDNAPLIEQILALRQQQAVLLGFENYAELSLARKMAPSVAAVEALMEELRVASYDAAIRELEEIKAFAQKSALAVSENEPENGSENGFEIKQWDVPFWTERMRESEFDLSDEALRPYFPLPKVLEGLFGLAERLFGIRISAADGQAPVWHDDVRYFQVADATKVDSMEDEGKSAAIAHFYLDPYSRPAEKRGGAWMDECIVRAKVRAESAESTESVRLPVAYLVCNQSPPVDDKPSLMTFGDVETLFHEFGHGLQHMLTLVDYPGAAGINNVEWDAVELPSQFMENWCYDRDTLFGMARHYETGEVLPEADYQKLLAARHFMTGNAILRQVNFGWVDMALHAQYQPGAGESVAQIRDRISQKTSLIAPIKEDAFLCSFGHIFSGGYAAGYYSYFWAEVLSADAFSAFEEAGLDNADEVTRMGQRFRDTVLALGGSHHPMDVFKAFRGREPSTEALLRHRGLTAA